MKKAIYDTVSRRHTLITFLGITVLAFLTLVNAAGAAPFAYVTNSGDNSVSVINTATNRLQPR